MKICNSLDHFILKIINESQKNGQISNGIQFLGTMSEKAYNLNYGQSPSRNNLNCGHVQYLKLKV